LTKKQDRYFNSFRVNGELFTITSKSDLSAATISRGIDALCKDPSIRWEKVGVFEDEAVQEVLRLKGIPTT